MNKDTQKKLILTMTVEKEPVYIMFINGQTPTRKLTETSKKKRNLDLKYIPLDC